MSLLRIKGISKHYKKKTALFPFSIEISEGECIALCGGNGAGKSTILNILAGISKPSEGSVVLNDIDMASQRIQYVSHIGYMPDEFNAQGEMSVEEFLLFYASLRAVSKERVDEMIETLGLTDKRKDHVKSLSKGMRQRLLFGQAWLDEPDLIILDEPTNGLDPYWINEFIELIRQIKQKGTMIIFSTHMMDVAADTADRVLFIEDGKLSATLENDFSNVSSFMQKLIKMYRRQD